MDLIASADVAADNILDYSVTPAAQSYVIGEHIVRIPRCRVLAVACLSDVRPPAYPFPQVPSAPGHYSVAAHSFVGFRHGGTGAWEYAAGSRAEHDDCTAVSFRVYVGQGWAGVNGLIFQTGPVLPRYATATLEHYRLVFDAITGAIRFTLTVSRTEDAEDADLDVDGYALAAAREIAPDGVQLRVRPLERPLPAGRHYRVDTASGAVVEVVPREPKGR
ncbi:hypothetical protein Dvina_37075 [Dactylosporangium vinaceum]|uniref:Uncharacterized protein n=1 Tax=Dactylosporangium vinaceum TaxID=53362 RepID=A0ABV5MIR4_9ACTN|nr:hypothetical protein [Dactylosporangium vinaceum]UAB93782.1 hypothetical protein Dvina_37075 [Dactylosporangium vinaceum]